MTVQKLLWSLKSLPSASSTRSLSVIHLLKLVYFPRLFEQSKSEACATYVLSFIACLYSRTVFVAVSACRHWSCVLSGRGRKRQTTSANMFSLTGRLIRNALSLWRSLQLELGEFARLSSMRPSQKKRRRTPSNIVPRCGLTGTMSVSWLLISFPIILCPSISRMSVTMCRSCSPEWNY